MKVAIIGGGWAGIAAAVELTAARHHVTLFEAGRNLGGRAKAIQINEKTVDNGQHTLLGAYQQTLELMRQIGVSPDDVLARHPLCIRNNRNFLLKLPSYLPAPLNLAAGLLGAKGVGWLEKIKAARWINALQSSNFQLPEDITVSDWLNQAKQTGVLRQHLWEPLCLAALNTRPEQASAQRFANVLRDSLGSPKRSDTDLLLPKTTLSDVLPSPAEHWLRRHGADIRLQTRVRNIASLDAKGYEINGTRFNALIMATAPQHASALLKQLPLAEAAFKPEFQAEFEPIGTVYLQYPPNTRLPYPLYGLAGGVGQWVIDRGNGLLAGVYSAHGDWQGLNNQQLAAALHAELGISAPPSWQAVIREARASYCCKAGYQAPAIKTGLPLCYQIGDYTWPDYPATLESAVCSGRFAARALSDTGA